MALGQRPEEARRQAGAIQEQTQFEASRSSHAAVRVLVLCATIAIALGWTAVANAGYGISPNSATTTARPTFTVYLEPQELYTATVYVSADAQYDSSFYPLHGLGSCSPLTTTANQFEYSCQPSYYSTSNFGSSLPPGTYFWWLVYYHRDPGSFLSTRRISGPLMFTVPRPEPPVGAGLVSPADGVVLSVAPTLRIHAPANSEYAVYVSTSSEHASDGQPAGATTYSCSGSAATDSDYVCTVDAYLLNAGQTYYWWVTIDLPDGGWIYSPRSFSLYSPPTSGGGGGGGNGSGNNVPHSIDDAYLLPSSLHFTGRSIKQTRLSRASYALSKIIGAPKTIAVACWSGPDWTNVGGDSADGLYTTLAFWTPLMPHWIHLSPGVCRSIETLLYHRPRFPNAILANAVETVTHEMMHALGINRQRYGTSAEALAECYGMQLSIVMALELHVPLGYDKQLARLNLANYAHRPPEYQNFYNCREDGAWDLFKNRPSPPWHDFPGL